MTIAGIRRDGGPVQVGRLAAARDRIAGDDVRGRGA